MRNYYQFVIFGYSVNCRLVTYTTLSLCVIAPVTKDFILFTNSIPNHEFRIPNQASAIASTSTKTFLGRDLTATHERAGFDVKYLP